MKYKKLIIASAFLLALLTAQLQAGFYDWLVAQVTIGRTAQIVKRCL